MNFLYCELVMCNRDKYLSSDEKYQRFIYNILSHYSEYTEYLYRIEWDITTRQMSPRRKKMYRKKLDRFVWRIETRLSGIIEYQVIFSCLITSSQSCILIV